MAAIGMASACAPEFVNMTISSQMNDLLKGHCTSLWLEIYL
jgi:hypothetical protein